MTSNLLNRISTFLAFAGVFVAGVLSAGHWLNVSVPCGSGKGCEVVANHPSSFWFGVPVAYFGLAAYAVLAFLSVWRSFRGTERSRLPMLAGFVLVIVSLAVQFGLTIYAMMVIRETCTWCLASTLILFLLFIVHMMLMQKHAVGKPIDASKSPFELMYVAALGVAVLGLLGWQATHMKEKAGFTPISKEAKSLLNVETLAGDGAHILGDPNAPITIVEFADLFCPACRRSYPAVHDMVQNSNGKIRLVFRHMPLYQLEGHELSLNASVLAEIAGERGKFFDYLDAIYAAPEEEVKTLDGLKKILTALGIEPEGAIERSSDPEDSAFKRMYADIELSSKLGVQITPSFIILADGVEPNVTNGNNLLEALASDKYAKFR